jgi:hypothetical protein
MDLLKRLYNVSISLTNGIRDDNGVQYDGVAQSRTKVTGVRIKRCKVRAWMNVLGVKSKGSWHGLNKGS